MLKTTDNAPAPLGRLRALIAKWRTGRGQRALLFARDLEDVLDAPVDIRAEPDLGRALEREDVARWEAKR